jgi:hypothetical protein
MEKGTIELMSGDKIACYSLTKEEYLNYLNNPNIQRIEEFNQIGLNVFKIERNKVVIEENGYYTLYDDINDFKLVIGSLGNNSNGQEVLYGLNPFGNEFPKNVEKILKELSDALQIEINENYITSEKIFEIDKKIESLDSQFYEKYFIHIIALIGQALNCKYHSDWRMELSDDNQTWNTFLQLNDQKIVFHTYLYEDIFINSKDAEHIILGVFDTVSDIIEINILKKGQ